jgi:hypothetical protein
MNSPHRRWTALLAAAVFGTAPALLAAVAPAYAAPGAPTVEFSGGSVLNTVACRSQPSAASLTVDAETRITFVNRLGQPASLKIDGRVVSQVGANQAVPVMSHHGPVRVSMAFACNVGVVEEFKSVTVAVTPKAAPTPVATANQAASGSGGGSPSRITRSPAPAPPDAGMLPPGAPSANSSAAGVPGPFGGTSEGGPGASANSADVGNPVAASGEPVHAPSGLLAMVASVLVIGVGVAGVRSAFARRTTRSRFA